MSMYSKPLLYLLFITTFSLIACKKEDCNNLPADNSYTADEVRVSIKATYDNYPDEVRLRCYLYKAEDGRSLYLRPYDSLSFDQTPMDEFISIDDCGTTAVHYVKNTPTDGSSQMLQWQPRDGEGFKIPLPKVGTLENNSGAYVIHEYCWQGEPLGLHETIHVEIEIELEDEDGESYMETFDLNESTPGKTCVAIPLDILEQVQGRVGRIDATRSIRMDNEDFGIYSTDINISAKRYIHNQPVYFY